MLLQPYVYFSKNWFSLTILVPEVGRISITLPQDYFSKILTCFNLSLACMIFFFSHLQRAVTIAVWPRTRSSFCQRQRKKTLNFYSQITRWWQMAEVAETWAELQAAIHLV